jgi:UPF0288 family protein (methanogenesis marker protein 3)
VKTFLFVLLLSGACLLGQDTTTASASEKAKDAKDQVTIQGCVSRYNGDYILVKQNPGITYELQATGKIRLHSYFGQRVEVTGQESPSMSTSSDAMTKTGAAAPTTITISSIKTIAKECTLQ